MGWEVLWKVGTGQEVLPGIRDWSGDPARDLVWVGRSYGKSERGGEVLRKVWDGLRNLPEVRDG